MTYSAARSSTSAQVRDIGSGARRGSLMACPRAEPTRSIASSSVRSAMSPSRARLLTVPSGVPVRAAMSCCVSPAK